MILFILFNLDNNDVLAFLRNNNAHNNTTYPIYIPASPLISAAAYDWATASA
jgi:hypothetical protein